MGKKWKAAAFLSAFLLGTCLVSAPCMAAENTSIGESSAIEQQGGSASRSVYAKYESAGEDESFSAQVIDGKASVTLPDGTVVSVSQVPGDGLYLHVYPIPESTRDDSPWQWFVQQMEGKGTKMRPYDIWFEDAFGEVQEISGTILVSITPGADGEYHNPIVYYQPVPEGDPVNMNAVFDDGTIRFRTTHNSYYVLLEQTEESGGTGGESTQTPTGKSETEPSKTPTGTTGQPSQGKTDTTGRKTDSPKTGDETNVRFFVGIMLISLMTVAGCVIEVRKRKA